MKKKALVISGGGSKGAFAVGIIHQLVSQQLLSFDVVVGTSTGSLIAPLAALGRVDELVHLYTNISTDQIIIKDNLGNRLNEKSIFDPQPLWQKIQQVFDNNLYQEILNSGKALYFTTTCLQSEELVIFTTDIHAPASDKYSIEKIQNLDQFQKAIMASACQPVFMTPIKVNKNVPGYPHPDFQYVDGGVREYAGLDAAIAAGATDIIAILLSSAKQAPSNTEFKTMFPILQQTLDIFMEDVSQNDLVAPFLYNDALRYIDAVREKMIIKGVPPNVADDYLKINGIDSPWEGKKPLNIHILRPDAPLDGGPGGLDFVPSKMIAMMNAGAAKLTCYVSNLPNGNLDMA